MNLNVDDADADPTNEYNTGVSFDGVNLTVTDSGGNQSVDISGVSTDDQTAAEVTYDNTTSGLTATDVQAAIDEVSAGSTDDQNISGSGLAGTTLTIGIENGTNETVDLSSLVDDADADPTNEYNTGVSFDGVNLTVTDAGGNQSVDISGVSTDDQTISSSGAPGNISIETGNTLNLNVDDADADPTNEYNTGVSFDGTNLTVTDAGGNQSVDISGVSTDDQNISGSGLAGTTLTIGIENGTNETVDLSALVDDADADPTNEYNTGVSFDGTNLTVTDAGGNQSVDISGVSTDDQNISGSGLAGTTLTIGIENGTNETVDLSTLVGTDDQTAAEVTYDNTTSGLTATDVQAAIDEVSAGSTDDQNISGSGLAGTTLTIGIENGTNETVDLSALVDDADADPTNEYNTGVSFDGTNLTVTDAGGNQSVDISGVSTDDQNISGSGLAGTTLTIGIENGTNETVDLSALVDDADADPTNEYNTGVSFDGTNLTVTDAGGNQSVDISGVSTDDQNISGSGLAGTTLTIGIENGTNETVDLSAPRR